MGDDKILIQELIARFANSFDLKDWSGHCIYIFQLIKSSDWKISGITQKVLWNDGSSSIHKGAK